MKKSKISTPKSSIKTFDVHEEEGRIFRVKSIDKKFTKNHKNALYFEDDAVLDDEYYFGRFDIEESFYEVEEEFSGKTNA